jgi:hypothetical protein
VTGADSLIPIAVEYNEWYDANFAELDTSSRISY